MNSTNRALNRIFLIVVGLALGAAGLAALAVSTLPAWDDAWRRTAPSWQETAGRARSVGLAAVGLAPVPWPLLAVPVVAAILVAALLVFVFRQGHGRTGRVLERLPLAGAAAPATVSVDTGVAADVVRQALAGIPAVAGLGVSAYRVAGRPAMKLTVTPRRGVDPVAVVPRIEDALAGWDRLLGQQVPVFVHLDSGVRSALARPTRLAESPQSTAERKEEVRDA